MSSVALCRPELCLSQHPADGHGCLFSQGTSFLHRVMKQNTHVNLLCKLFGKQIEPLMCVKNRNKTAKKLESHSY